MFLNIRTCVRRRYAETVDFAEYEPKIQKLLDTHVGTGVVEQITPLVKIFDKDAFAEEVEKLPSASAKADTIAHRTSRTIYDRMQEDPAFYKRFSELLKQAIQAFREERLKATEYLKRVTEIMHSVLNRTDDRIPQRLKTHDVARAYFGSIREALAGFTENMVRAANESSLRDEAVAELALAIDTIIEQHRIVNWSNDTDVQNLMRNDIEDALFEFKERAHLDLSFEDIDAIMEQCLSIAKARLP